jgi:AraC-like DNA-binding protein
MASRYLERPAHPSLHDVVVCTWIDRPSEERHPVLPDACIDLVWDGRELRVAGPDTRPSPIVSHQTFVGLRFQPGAAPAMLGLPASELVDRTVGLAELWGDAALRLQQRLVDDPPATAEALEQAVRSRVDDAPAVDPVVRGLLSLLAHQPARRGTMAELAHELGVSERTLRRRCEAAIGYGPKMLARVLRFRRAVRLIGAGRSLAETAQVAGYADQAHLSHDLHHFAATTPGDVRRRPPVLSANGLRS